MYQQNLPLTPEDRKLLTAENLVYLKISVGVSLTVMTLGLVFAHDYLSGDIVHRIILGGLSSLPLGVSGLIVLVVALLNKRKKKNLIQGKVQDKFRRRFSESGGQSKKTTYHFQVDGKPYTLNYRDYKKIQIGDVVTLHEMSWTKRIFKVERLS